uniref:High affinity immunoglobulin epsilon receptor subunit gamma n=1 Tax=Oncorhynchus kisutch TaxID=8019 RepID=A0A8C7JPX4_ONCKI
MFRGSLILVALLLNFSMADGKLCYILDGILVIYGVILTILYCRLRVRNYKPSITHYKSSHHPQNI